MKEEVFNDLVIPYLDNAIDEDYSVVVLIQAKKADDTPLTPVSMDLSFMKDRVSDFVNDNFRWLTNKMSESFHHPDFRTRVYPEDFLNDYDIYGGGTAASTLEKLCEREGLIKKAAVIPCTAYNPFETLYADWVRISNEDLTNSYLVCVSWERNESAHSLSTSINLKENIVMKMA